MSSPFKLVNFLIGVKACSTDGTSLQVLATLTQSAVMKFTGLSGEMTVNA